MCAQPLQLCTPPSSSVHGILQARILEWVAMSSSRVSSQSRYWTCVSCIFCVESRFFTAEPPGKPPKHILLCIWITRGFPCGSAGKAPACNAGDLGFIPELGRFPGEGNGYPLQYSGLENCVDCIIYGVTTSWTQLSDWER